MQQKVTTSDLIKKIREARHRPVSFTMMEFQLLIDLLKQSPHTEIDWRGRIYR